MADEGQRLLCAAGTSAGFGALDTERTPWWSLASVSHSVQMTMLTS